MKKLIFVIITFFLSSCSSNKEVIKQIHQNSANYKELKNTQAKLLNSAIVYITKQNSNYLIKINSRIEQDVNLINCQTKNINLEIQPIESNNFFNTFLIVAPKGNSKISCTLDSSEKFTI